MIMSQKWLYQGGLSRGKLRDNYEMIFSTDLNNLIDMSCWKPVAETFISDSARIIAARPWNAEGAKS